MVAFRAVRHLDFISGEQVGHCASEFSIVRSKRCVRCIDCNQHPFIIGPTLKDELMVGQDNIAVASVAECIASGSDVDHFFDLFGSVHLALVLQSMDEGRSHYLVLLPHSSPHSLP